MKTHLLKHRGTEIRRILLLSFIPLLLCITVFQLISCTPTPTRGNTKAVTKKVKTPAPIYPDYRDVTIPVNIAPLNFLLREDCEAIQVEVGDITLNARGNQAIFDLEEWQQLLTQSVGKTLDVKVYALKKDCWLAYPTFHWTVVKDRIDPYLTYRLIEPDYEIWHQVELRERCIENFDERNLSSYKNVGDRCMNCHVYGNQDPALSMLYVRGEGGGAILNKEGKLRKLGIKTDDMVSGSVYYGFSPSGRYITFSTNLIIPAFHAKPDKRLEVFDSKSDVYVADLESNTIIRSPLLSDSLKFETFPTFSPDGKYIYYCVADSVLLPRDIKQLQYSLCRIPFDEKTGTIGNQVDTIVRSSATLSQNTKGSVCHPRISPDGHYLLYTVADYGTFPIWHPEADLQMMDLHTGAIDTLDLVNSKKSDTYHSWSSNSRWFVFASKRDDGLYGKPYFCYIDKNGKAHKPFCLPQKDPTFYDNFLKSFNVPELGKGRVPFDASDVAKTLKKDTEPFK